MRILPLFSLLFVLISCTADGVSAQKKLQADEFEQYLKSHPTVSLVDVRTPEEFGSGHLKGASNVNFYDPNFATQMSKLDKSKPLMVYCAVGGRSGQAALQLKQMGFKEVYDLAGGINSWRAKGKNTVQ